MAARDFNFNQSASGHGLNDIFPEKNMIQTCVHFSFPNISQLWLEVVLLSIYEPLVLKWTSQTQTTADHCDAPHRKNGINSRFLSHGAAWSLRRADRFEKFHESCALAPRNKPGTSVIRTRSSEECVSKVKLTIGDGYNIKLCVYIYICSYMILIYYIYTIYNALLCYMNLYDIYRNVAYDIYRNVAHFVCGWIRWSMVFVDQLS